MKLLASRLFAVFLTLIIGLVIWVVIGPSVAAAEKSIGSHVEAISSAIATFSVALIGIMAGAVAIATAIREGYWMKQFRLSGRMKEYLFYYGFTICCLFITHILAVYALVNDGLIRIILACVMLNALQAVWVMYGAHRITTMAETNN